ncbi:MAG: response regulator [Myxococcota bacterium]
MIVEDNSADAHYLKHQLSGVESISLVMTADDGDVALDMLHKRRLDGDVFPTLIFLDLRMPRMGGFQFLNAFQRDFAGSGCRVVVVTGSASDPDRLRSLEYETVIDYVVKPVDQLAVRWILRTERDRRADRSA